MALPINVSFADLTHTGQNIAVYDFPLGILYVAAYAQRELGDRIDFEVFKHPDDFSEYLETNTPKIACFSAFTWNMNLAYAYAQKIKAASPDTITIFGGPNFGWRDSIFLASAQFFSGGVLKRGGVLKLTLWYLVN